MAISVLDTIQVCDDCLAVIANGDYTGLDYYYSPDKAEERQEQIDAGIASFAPAHLSAGEDETEFSTRQCECCGFGLAGRRYEVFVLGEIDSPLS